jgi:transcriptional regulator with XRE-family HTH domain
VPTGFTEKGEVYMNHSKALMVVRAAKGLQQKDLADLLGVTSSYISRIESGERPMSTKMIDKLVEKTSIPRELIFLLGQDSKSLKAEDSNTVDKLSSELLRIIVRG